MTLKMITVKEIKALREETGLSVMQCQKALEEAGGDRTKAITLLKLPLRKVTARLVRE